MSLGQRVILYLLFLLGTVLFLISGVRAGDLFSVAGAACFMGAEGWAVVYLEWIRERDKFDTVHRRSEDQRAERG